MPDETTEVADIQQATAIPTTESSKPETLSVTQGTLDKLEKEARLKGEKDILKQLGVEGREELTPMLEQLKAIKEAEAKAESEKPELERLREENKRISKIELENTELKNELTKFKQEQILSGKGYKGRELRLAMVEVNDLINDDTSFEKALEIYLKDNPPSPPAPPLPEMAKGTGKPENSVRDTKNLSYMERLKLKNPEMYFDYQKR